MPKDNNTREEKKREAAIFGKEKKYDAGERSVAKGGGGQTWQINFFYNSFVEMDENCRDRAKFGGIGREEKEKKQKKTAWMQLLSFKCLFGMI